MTSSRAVLQVFEKYQKDRVTFVQTVAELATRPQVRVRIVFHLHALEQTSLTVAPMGMTIYLRAYQ